VPVTVLHAVPLPLREVEPVVEAEAPAVINAVRRR